MRRPQRRTVCYLLPLLAHTWAPGGQTPVILEHAGRAHLSLIAAVAPNGRLYVAGQDQAFTGENIVWFLTKLCSRYRKRDLIVIWQGRLCGWSTDSSGGCHQGVSRGEAGSIWKRCRATASS